MMTALNAHHFPHPHVLYAYPGAGHGVGIFTPDEPESATTAARDPSFATDQQARAELWPRLLALLARS